MNFPRSSTGSAFETLLLSFETQNPGHDTLKIPKGQCVELLSQDVFVVRCGWVLLTTLYHSGDQGILSLLRPSQPFGRPLTHLVSYNAVALTDVELISLSISEIEQSPLLAQSLFQELTQRLKQSEAMLSFVQMRPVETRLRHLLKFLGDETGERTPQGMRVGVRLTHEQLGGMISSSRVTVTSIIKDFRAEGWLSVGADRHLLIIDM